MKPLVLLTNDDGYFAEGIAVLARSLRREAETVIVSPDREKSGTSLSLTLRRPLRVERVQKNVYSTTGTPVDCIYLALKLILPKPPDLIISGINRGPNLGRQDVSYSGTVAAAIQGTYLRIPSIAVSAAPDSRDEFDFDFSAEVVRKLAIKIFKNRLPPGLTLNLNIPPPPVRGYRMTKLGERRYNPEIIEKRDPRGHTCYWIGSGKPVPIGDRSSDVYAVAHGFISVTPLQTDLTDYVALNRPTWKKIFQGLA